METLTTAEMLRKIANDTANEKNELVNRLFASNQKLLQDQIHFNTRLIEANKAKGTLIKEDEEAIEKMFTVVAWIDGLAIFFFLAYKLYFWGL